jgi:hypothetical protein
MNPHQERPIQLFPDGVRCLILVDDFQQSQHAGCAGNESGNDCAKNAVCFLRYFNNFRFFFHAILLSVLGSGCSQVFPEKESRKQITFVPALFRFDDDFHVCLSGLSGSFEESVFPHAAPEVFSLGRLADDDVIKHVNTDNFSCINQHTGR